MKIKINNLYKRAIELRNSTQTIEDIENINKTDMTNMFFAELENYAKHGELIIINVNGKVRMGKSTIGLYLGKYVYDLIKKYYKNLTNTEFGMKNICLDQTEYVKAMRNPKTGFTCLVTDEENELEKTGQDASIIKAQEEDFSNVQADRYVHRICCSPNKIVDPNADILIDVRSKDEKTGNSYCKIHYRWYEAGNEYTQELGYIIINVNSILQGWKKAKPLYYAMHQANKTENTEEEEKLLEKIEEIGKKDWYTTYYLRKRYKIDLIAKYKINKARMLPYAQVILDIITKFKTLCKHTNIDLLKKDMIKNHVKIGMKKLRIPQSIIGEELTTNETKGVLDSQRSLYKIQKEIEKTKTKKGLQEKDIEMIKELEELQKILIESLDEEIGEYIRMNKVNELYTQKYGEKT